MLGPTSMQNNKKTWKFFKLAKFQKKIGLIIFFFWGGGSKLLDISFIWHTVILYTNKLHLEICG